MLSDSSKSPVSGQVLSFAELQRCASKPGTGRQLGDLLAPTVPTQAQTACAAVAAGPKPPDVAIEFLKHLDRDGRHNLVAIDPEKKVAIEGRTFPPGAWADMFAWINAHEGRRNLYYSVNEPRADAPDGKLRKEHIARIRAIPADIDPAAGEPFDRERERLLSLASELQSGPVQPSVTVDSGGGIQALWLLAEKLPTDAAREAVEAQARGIADSLGGDGVGNIDRIMRLPGTMNLPDAGKQAKGRTARRASVIATSDASYGLAEIAAQYAPASHVEKKDRSPEIQHLMGEIDMHTVTQASSYAELSADLRGRFEASCDSSTKLRSLWETGVSTGKNSTASAARFDLGKFLKADGSFTPDEFGALLWVWEHATSAGKPKIEDWDDFDTRREIARCWINSPEIAPPLDPAGWLTDLTSADMTAAQTDPFGAALERERRPATRRFELVSLAEAGATALARSSKPLVKGLLDQGALTVLYGESNTGKTFVAMDMAFHIATGRAWTGCRTEHMGVVYVAAEGGQGVRKRARALMMRHGDETAAAARFCLILSSVDLRRPEADLAPLVETINSSDGVGLVVIDTLSRALAGGDENSSIDMGALVKHVDRLRHQTGAHVMLVHHMGKERARGARGHSLLRAAVDTEIEVADNEIAATKQRDLDGSFRRAFVLDPVEIGKDEDGDPITSCTVRWVSQDELPAGEPTAGEIEVLNALGALHEDNLSAVWFKTEDVAGACVEEEGGRTSVDTVRTRLRRMAAKRLVQYQKPGRWRLNRDNVSRKSGQKPLTTFLQPIEDGDLFG